MLDFVLWYVLISITGWLVFPIAYRMLPFLQDRGVAILRPIGLLLWGFVFWLLASLQVLINDAGGLLTGLIVVAVLSGVAGSGCWGEIRDWLKTHTRTVLVVEGLFFVLFAAWAIVRAANPDVQFTESSMELAFINSILRSEVFPPRDPWLSGYAISYYYFGYVMVAMLAGLTGVSGAVSFNLAHALWFAMSGTAAFGLVYTLLVRWFRARPGHEHSAPGALHTWALLGPLFLLIVSNLEGFLAMLHARGLFWSQAADGTWHSNFWTWLGIQDLNQPPRLPLTWLPHPEGGWPWWRASRVLTDYNFAAAGPVEVIDEFPFFSYLLGDLHPHVLSMPFVLLAIGLALNLYLSGRRLMVERSGWTVWLWKPYFWLAAVTLGGLAFLNTWDFPIYVALFAGAYALSNVRQGGSPAQTGSWLKDFAGMGVLLGVAGGALYLPFYLGFQSQAGGILPSLIFFTPGKNFWVMFGALLLPITAWLIFRWRAEGSLNRLKAGAAFAVIVVAGLWLLSILFGVGLLSFSSLANSVGGQVGELLQEAGTAFRGVQGIAAGQKSSLISASIQRRLASPGAWLSLGVLLAITWGLIAPHRKSAVSRAQTRFEEQVLGGSVIVEDFGGSGFVLLLVLLGLGLVIFPEFFYLRDHFGTRMNTIFKFYYQAWILFAIAAAYGSAVLLRSLTSLGGLVFRLGWIVLLAAGLVYPLTMLPRKTSNFKPPVWTLDASNHLARSNPDVAAAIEWLREAPIGVLAEGVTPSYDYFRLRYSVFSGQPAVIGWPGHESQWGRDPFLLGQREMDMRILFTTPNWSEAQPILAKYDVRYVIVGPNEFGVYDRPGEGMQVNEEKFQVFLKPVYQNGSVRIYEVPQVYREEQTALMP